MESTPKDPIQEQKVYAHVHTSTRDLVEAIGSIRLSVLIGGSIVGKAFTQAVIEAICRVNERPIIFALSNPTERAECTPEEAYRWSQGKGIYTVSVQFPPVHYNGDNLSFNCSYGRG